MGDPLGFFNIHSVPKLKKIEGDTLGKNFPQKSLARSKKLIGGPFGLVRYCKLRENHFWFSSLRQQEQFEIL